MITFSIKKLCAKVIMAIALIAWVCSIIACYNYKIDIITSMAIILFTACFTWLISMVAYEVHENDFM